MATSQYKRPPEADLLALARMVAKVAHSGQTRRRNGEPYFNHVERVAESVREEVGERAATIAYLHDTIEDTTVRKQTLIELGFDKGVVHDVIMLTRTPPNDGAGEEYMHYIGRLIEYGSEDALQVKLADLMDNLRDLDTRPFDTDSLRRRYLKAQGYIMDELKRRTEGRAVRLEPALSA